MVLAPPGWGSLGGGPAWPPPHPHVLLRARVDVRTEKNAVRISQTHLSESKRKSAIVSDSQRSGAGSSSHKPNHFHTSQLSLLLFHYISDQSVPLLWLCAPLCIRTSAPPHPWQRFALWQLL